MVPIGLELLSAACGETLIFVLFGVFFEGTEGMSSVRWGEGEGVIRFAGAVYSH